MVSQIRKVKVIGVVSEIEAFLLEEKLIKKYKPRYNIKLTDGKSYPFVKITIKEKYPKVLLVRKENNDGSLYFGPYTKTSALKSVLKMLRKIFPYQSVVNHPRNICFYNHLGLCPCPSVTNDKDYRKTINYIVDFLNGKTKKIIKELIKERNLQSDNENYEEAENIQNKINAINMITKPFHKPFEYEKNPNLRSDILKEETQSLQKTLLENNLPVKNLERIECYDISNTSGKNPTASMVVFTNAEKDGSSYRRFRIQRFYNNKQNDFAMIEEVLERRLKHKEWPYPSLIVIDGGKGQVSAAKKVLLKNKIKIALIGIAKREEIIITSNLKEIRLPKDSKALHLIMRIRDEAHRFAISYHRKLRSKFIPAI